MNFQIPRLMGFKVGIFRISAIRALYIIAEVPRLEVQTWCIDSGFELVELNPEVETDSENVEDDFLETTGIDRVIQALHAHTWSNLQMIGRSNVLLAITGRAEP